MNIAVEMTEQDHFLALMFVREATPTFMGPTALGLLTSAVMVPGRLYRIDASLDALDELRWAMGVCVDLIEGDCSKIATSCCDAFDHEMNVELALATQRLKSALQDYVENIDHDGDEDAEFGDVSCGPEYPRNDAGEWLGRM